MRLVECGVLAVLIGGCGRYHYDPLDAAADGGVELAPRVVGSAICEAGTVSIDTSVPAGSVVVVQAMVRGDGGDCAVADSRLNSYELLAAPGADQLRISVFASALATGLLPGDTIEVTHPAGTSASVIAVELAGAAGLPSAVFEGGAGGYAVDVPFSPPATGVSYCAVAVRNATFEIDPPWIDSAALRSECGSGAPDTAHNTGYWTRAGSGATRCSGAITGGAESWRAVVATFPE